MMSYLPPMELVAPRDAIVRIVGEGNVTCTGTLIADDRVLTAHHCVAARDKKGHVLPRDVSPDELQIELGGDELPWGEVKVRAIVAPLCGYVSGEGDIASSCSRATSSACPPPWPASSPSGAQGRRLPLRFGRCALSPGASSAAPGATPRFDVVARGHFEAKASVCPATREARSTAAGLISSA